MRFLAFACSFGGSERVTGIHSRGVPYNLTLPGDHRVTTLQHRQRTQLAQLRRQRIHAELLPRQAQAQKFRQQSGRPVQPPMRIGKTQSQIRLAQALLQSSSLARRRGQPLEGPVEVGSPADVRVVADVADARYYLLYFKRYI